MKKNPLINILTRTSGRPNYFKVCKDSIDAQTYKNIRHIVSVDDDISFKYVNNSCIVKVDKFNGNIPFKRGRRPAPYNLYFNDLHKEIKEGWIMYIDDDNMFSSSNSLEEIVNHISSEDDLILWKVDFKKRVVPEKDFFYKKPVLNHFDTNSFLYHSKYVDSWSYYSGGDFDYIMKIWDNIKNKIWIDLVLTSNQREKDNTGGRGRKDDIM